MPETALWGLIISLIILALGLTLKNTDIRRRLKQANEDIARAKSELQWCQERFNQEISDIQKLDQRRINELSEQIATLQSELAQKTAVPHRDNLLDDAKINILKLLFHNDILTTDNIASLLKYDIQTTKVHLEELRIKDMIKEKSARSKHDRPIMVWTIDQPGRRYLIENKQ